MAFTKYASREPILEVKTSSERIEPDDANPELGLSKFASLPKNMDENDGYLYVRTRAISSRVNKNNDGWPAQELAAGYRTFLHRPIFVDHNNDDPLRARGVVVSTKLHVEDEKTSALDPYYATAPDNHKPHTWIELLLEVDAKTYPKLAEDIRTGKIDATSMGANIEKSVCSVCNNEATTPSQYCSHIKQKGMTFEITADNGEKVKRLAYEDCYGVNFFEDSFVFDPADATALVLDKVGSVPEITLETLDLSDPEHERQFLAALKEHGIPVTKETKVNERELLKALVLKEQLEKKALKPSVQDLMEPVGTDKPVGDRNQVPQSDLVTAPEEVDTLRNDMRCPICHSGVMDPDPDGIVRCPTCGHVQEPEPLDNPDLTKAQDADMVAENQDTGDHDAQEVKIQDVDQLGQQQQAPSNTSIAAGVISEMWTTKLETESKAQADKALPVVKEGAVTETTIGFKGAIHMGTHMAFKQAGITATVTYPDGEQSVLPGNPMKDLMLAAKTVKQLGLAGPQDIPITVESDNLDEALEIIHAGGMQPQMGAPEPRPVARQAKKTKNVTPGKPRSDEPQNEKVVSDQFKPVTSGLQLVVDEDGVVRVADTRQIKRHEQSPDGTVRTEEIIEQLTGGEPSGEAAPTEEAAPEDSVEIQDGSQTQEPAYAATKEAEIPPSQPVPVSAPGSSCPQCGGVLDAEGNCPQCGYRSGGAAPVPGATVASDESKLLTVFALAELAEDLGIVDSKNKLAWIAEVEQESLEQIEARQKMLESVKQAGLSRSAARKVQGVKPVPRLSYTKSQDSGSFNGSVDDDFPIEAIFN